MENLPSILTPDLGLLFWMLLAFLVVFGVLAKFGFPAIVGMVEERKKFIDESLKSAHEAAERLTNIQQESEAIVQQARLRRPFAMPVRCVMPLSRKPRIRRRQRLLASWRKQTSR